MKKRQMIAIIGVLIAVVVGVFYFNNRSTAKVCVVEDVVLTSTLQFKEADRIPDVNSADDINIEIKSNCDKLEIKLGLYSQTTSADPERMGVAFRSKQLYINDEIINDVVLDDLRLATTPDKNEFRVSIDGFKYAEGTYSSKFEFKRITDGYELMNKDEILVKE